MNNSNRTNEIYKSSSSEELLIHNLYFPKLTATSTKGGIMNKYELKYKYKNLLEKRDQLYQQIESTKTEIQEIKKRLECAKNA